MPEASSDPSPVYCPIQETHAFVTETRKHSHSIEGSSREIDYVARPTSTFLEYAYISSVMVRSERDCLFETCSRKIFRFSKNISQTFSTLGKCSPNIFPRIFWEYFVLEMSHHFRITISRCVSICYARVYMCVYMCIYIYFFIYIYFWL